ncbi:MAG TPA: RNA 2'-phosphotransferase [Candidatus Binatia bacterium]|jgi:putative RNA 2'-phosphotransferase|nr:RNA 2'-phosphotransferase [Candidatus Binatia bacterium]
MAGLAPERISRFLTYILRHRPQDYPLVFDEHGFVDWRDVVQLVQERYYDVTEEQIRAVVVDAEKKRFELAGDKVRATYGHSFPIDFGQQSVQPPDSLYYGTARDLAQSMLRNGLKPRDRQYVHLSVSAEEAESVARRHDPTPAVIVVQAGAAHDEGVRFYRSGPLFLTENVPARFLSLK